MTQPSPSSLHPIAAMAWADKPALIERLFPAQQISVESYKEQMAVAGKTLTALGSYWKGRKPLVLNRACILSALLPAHDPHTEADKAARDLLVFQILMGMDPMGLYIRSQAKKKDKAVDVALSFPVDAHALAHVSDVHRELLGQDVYVRVQRQADDLFDLTGSDGRRVSLAEFQRAGGHGYKVVWKKGAPESLQLAAGFLAHACQGVDAHTFKVRVEAGERAENVDHMTLARWALVNAHLGTTATTLPELVEQMGVARFGRRPRVADTFSGSGQIPFEAARIGCEAYASDLNPMACLLTWGAFNIVGAGPDEAARIERQTQDTLEQVKADLDAIDLGAWVDKSGHSHVLKVEQDTDTTTGRRMRIKALLYCATARCAHTGVEVPTLPTLVVSKPKRLVVDLRFVPEMAEAWDGPGHYELGLKEVSAAELKDIDKAATMVKGELVHRPKLGMEFRTPVSQFRGDHKGDNGRNANRLRPWTVEDVAPKPDDILGERLYAILWEVETGAKKKNGDSVTATEFRAASPKDLAREAAIARHMESVREDWQQAGHIPDMAIEPGDKTSEPIRTRGWTHWHHLFNPRQLLLNGLFNKHATTAEGKVGVANVLNRNSRLCHWIYNGVPAAVFYNQALNTVWNYGARGLAFCEDNFRHRSGSAPIAHSANVINSPVSLAGRTAFSELIDIFVTDPPYGDAVKYEEIYEFFISWLRKNPPPPMNEWVWDSRRALAVKGEDEGFRQGMIHAYKAMNEGMTDNGLQVLMFTHQSEGIWADLANIVWASGLQVTAAWYVATEVETRLSDNAHVKGTVLLVLRKRSSEVSVFSDDLAYAIAGEVRAKVEDLRGLNQTIEKTGQEVLFSDADLQMAAYAAALNVLTSHRYIDGKDMVFEASRPRRVGEKTLVDQMIAYAVEVANQHLIPTGIQAGDWSKLSAIERFYLKMTEYGAAGSGKLDTFQNFAKAYKVSNHSEVMDRTRGGANAAGLLMPGQMGKDLMSESYQMGGTLLRGVLYAIHTLNEGGDGDLAMAALEQAVTDWNRSPGEYRARAQRMAQWLAGQWSKTAAADAGSAAILSERLLNYRI